MKTEFKTLLEEIKKNEYDFKNIDLQNLLNDLLVNIGDHDPYHRDDLVYPVLAHLLHDSVLEKEQLKEITFLLLGNEYLFFDIDNDIEYSVLIRSFSQLQIAVLLHVHNRDTLFDESEMNQIYNTLIKYFKEETDLRGYVQHIGFLHSVAHTVDSFHQLIKAKEIKDYQLRSIMDIIKAKFDISYYQFAHDEDERAVNVLETIIRQNKLDNEYLELWVDMTGDYQRPSTYPEVYHQNINIKSLLRSLYFRFIYEKEYNFLTDKIRETLKEKVTLK